MLLPWTVNCKLSTNDLLSINGFCSLLTKQQTFIVLDSLVKSAIILFGAPCHTVSWHLRYHSLVFQGSSCLQYSLPLYLIWLFPLSGEWGYLSWWELLYLGSGADFLYLCGSLIQFKYFGGTIYQFLPVFCWSESNASQAVILKFLICTSTPSVSC